MGRGEVRSLNYPLKVSQISKKKLCHLCLTSLSPLYPCLFLPLPEFSSCFSLLSFISPLEPSQGSSLIFLFYTTVALLLIKHTHGNAYKDDAAHRCPSTLTYLLFLSWRDTNFTWHTATHLCRPPCHLCLTETSCDATWHKTIWNQTGLLSIPCLQVNGSGLSGPASYLNEPEGGVV